VTVRAHFDGKAIIPDEPLDLAPNQTVIVQVEAVPTQDETESVSVLDWLIANAVESDELPTDLSARPDYYLYGTREQGPRS
jgi:hypothetical protein